MCAVSPNTHIAVAGYRAVVEYLFWFFLVTRLIETTAISRYSTVRSS